jgi:hypothetical protein
MPFVIIFEKEMGRNVPFEDCIFTFQVLDLYENEDKCLEMARRMNKDCWLNLTLERFKVFETDNAKGKYNKRAKLIYPTPENPLFF